MANRANEWIKEKLRELRSRRGNKCAICGEGGNSRTLQFCHVRKTPLSGISHRGRKERYYDIIKHPRSYILAHRKCHFKKFRKQHSNAIKKGMKQAAK
jgi:hypothetical protein